MGETVLSLSNCSSGSLSAGTEELRISLQYIKRYIYDHLLEQ